MPDSKDAKGLDFKFTLRFSYKILVWILVATNVLTLLAILLFWQPWEGEGVPGRTVTVTGEAILEAEPDEYQFSPTYDITGDTQEAVLAEATAKANEVVEGLKALGVQESDMQLNAGSYDYYYWMDDDEVTHTTVGLTITLNDRDLTQSVQDYLLTTEPEGQLTPWPTFSNEKSDELETEARGLALADARTKAEQAATELEVRVGKVVSIQDGYGFDQIMPMYAEGRGATATDMAVSSSMPILPGENEFTFSVTVVFEIK